MPEKKTFEVGYETDSFTTYTQPSFFMATACLILTYFTSVWADYLLPTRFKGKMLNGIRFRSFVSIPYILIGSSYVAVAATLARGMDMAGHFAGLGVSTIGGLALSAMFRTSFIYPVLGAPFLAFGGVHHYRKLMIITDNAPLYHWGDMSAIWTDFKARRRARYKGPKTESASNEN